MIHHASWGELSPAVLHDLVRLRVDVFVVEQQCPYAELDGRDADESAVHVWAESDGTVAGYLRILAEPGGTRRIGRVCVAAHARGRGVARELMDVALGLVGDRRVVLDAQTYLAPWYERLGFTPCGPEFVEDGIPHVPMTIRGS